MTEDSGTVIQPGEMWDVFSQTYLPEEAGVRLLASEMTTGGGRTTVTAQLLVDGEPRTVMGEGNGPIDALVTGLRPRPRDQLRGQGLQRARPDRGQRCVGRGLRGGRGGGRVDLVGRGHGLEHPRRLAGRRGQRGQPRARER